MSGSGARAPYPDPHDRSTGAYNLTASHGGVSVVEAGSVVAPGADVNVGHAKTVTGENVRVENAGQVFAGAGPVVPPAGSAGAAMVDRRTRRLRPPPVLVGLVARSKRHRWCVVTGSAGSGKSTVLAALARPGLCEGVVPEQFVHALVELSQASPLWWLASELADHLRSGLPEYPGAVAACRAEDAQAFAELNLWERNVVAPLAWLARHRSPDARPVRVVVDGWEQVRADDAEPVHAAIAALASRDDLNVHVIVGARSEDAARDERLTSAHRLELPFPDEDTMEEYLQSRGVAGNDAKLLSRECVRGASGWLIASLLADCYGSLTPGDVRDIAATRTGPAPAHHPPLRLDPHRRVYGP